MPMRSAVTMLPEDVRTELERRIVERGFSGYEDLAQWLRAQGYQITHDSVQRHGAKLARKIQAMERLTDEAKAMAAAGPHVGSILLDTAVQLISQKVVSLLLEDTGRGDESDDPHAGKAEDRGEIVTNTPAFPGPALAASTSDSGDGRQPLALMDLVRMARIVADLNRVAANRRRDSAEGSRGEQGKGTSGEPRPMSKGLSEEAYFTIRNILFGIDPNKHHEHREGFSEAGFSSGAAPEQSGRGVQPDPNAARRR